MTSPVFRTHNSHDSKGRSHSDDETVVEWSSEDEDDAAIAKSTLQRSMMDYYINMPEEVAVALLVKEIQSMSAVEETEFADFLDELNVEYDRFTNKSKLAWIHTYREFEAQGGKAELEQDGTVWKRPWIGSVRDTVGDKINDSRKEFPRWNACAQHNTAEEELISAVVVRKENNDELGDGDCYSTGYAHYPTQHTWHRVIHRDLPNFPRALVANRIC